MTISACVLCLILCRVGAAQSFVGSTTLDIDPASGVVVATCETDLDADTQAFYRAGVECKIEDDAGKQLATGEYIDKDGAEGFARLVLVIKGVPGMTYTAKGSHLLEDIFEYADPLVAGSPGERQYFDPFDFSRLERLHETYSTLFEWMGQARDTQRQK
jgi:hypothetical protein